MHPEDSNYLLPGLAFGFDDIIGTRAFKAGYVVVTQVIPCWDLEFTLGYGNDRICGLFGGVLWAPYRSSCNPFLKGMSFSAEYDATDYANDPHPAGKTQKQPWNLGVKYRLFDYFDSSVAWMRGEELAWSLSAQYNFGCMQGFIPKIKDPLFYSAPCDLEPIGPRRTEELLIQELYYALSGQGLELLAAWNTCGTLRLRIYNSRYWKECDVHGRIISVLSQLIPENIEEVITIIEAEGFLSHEYRFPNLFLKNYRNCSLGEYELALLTTKREVSCVDPCSTRLLFKDKRPHFCFDLKPKIHNFFGSAAGKFKYSIGVHFGAHGFLPGEVYYEFLFGYNFDSKLYDIGDIDRLNPSQLINVQTDLINYLKQDDITLDIGYLQKNWNMGGGWFSRISGGYFSEMYGGVAGEILWSPACARWAIGVEGATVWKRRLNSPFQFTGEIRKLNGFTPTYVPFTGTQAFLDLYYDWSEIKADAKISVGQFLAKDVGARFEFAKYYPSGLRFYFWYTLTNGGDRINGETYYDKGIGFSMPLDIFYMYSCRKSWNYSLSAWLRDVGYRTPTGKGLYDLLSDVRKF